MNESLSTALFQLARQAQRDLGEAGRHWVEDLRRHFRGGPKLYQLAQEVTGGACASDMEVLPTFFTTEAIDLLLALPYQSWFWKVVAEASCLSAADQAGKIDVEDVRKAIQRFRNAAQRRISLDKEIDQLSLDETAYWMACGIILIDTSEDIVKRVRNPMFDRGTR